MKALLSIIVGVSVQCLGQAEIICFDVAQGNSVVVGSTDPYDEALPCLIDAGCKAYTFRGTTFKADQVVRIAEALCRFASISNQYFYNVIISHPDEDHYDMLPDIVKNCRARGLEPYKIILGGVRRLYNKNFQAFLDDLVVLPEESSDSSSSSEDSWEFSYYKDWCSSSEETSEEEQHIPRITYFTEKGSTKRKIPVEDEGSYLSYSIMPALKSTTEAEKNDGSLVVLIEYADLSFLITGDATEATTEHILKYCPDLRVNGIHGSHHGGESDGSNNSRWFRKLKPEVMVFSSGINKMYRHPRGAVMQRAEKYLPDSDGAYRPVYYPCQKTPWLIKPGDEWHPLNEGSFVERQAL